MKDHVYEELRKAIISVSRVSVLEEDIKPNTNLVDDLGFESVSLVELIITIEESFDIEFDDNAMISVFDSVENLAEYVCCRMSNVER